MTSTALPFRHAGRLFRGQTGDRLLRAALKLADLRAVHRRRQFNALRTEFYDGLWRQVAADLGAEVRALPGDLHEIRRGDLRSFVRHSDLMLDDTVTLRLMADKALSYDLMRRAGVTVADHCSFRLADLSPARALLERHPEGIAVKPATGTGGGRGVTTGVRTIAELQRAARHAASFNGHLLAERMLTGHSYRLLFLDGDCLDVVRRDRPAVTGDGRASIRDLIAAENTARRTTRPLTALSPLIADADCRNHLAAQGLSLSSCPRNGQGIEVKGACNENTAAQNHVVRDLVHPGIVAQGAELVRRLGVRFAGLDVMARDISLPLKETGGSFCEVNVNPGLHHHYLIAVPAAGLPVATLVLEWMFATRQGVMAL